MRKWLVAATLLVASCGSSTPSGSAGVTSPTTTGGVTTPQAQLLTVNAGGGNSSLPLAWSFQVQYPARYLVTDDWMLTGYNSQGGVAPPRLAFTVGSQFMSLNSSAFDLLKAGDRDCILIWSTLGFQSISDWERLTRTAGPGPVVSERTQQFGSFTFVVREVVVAGTPSNASEAFVQLPQNLSYFFTTCNANSKADLFTVLQTFRVRS